MLDLNLIRKNPNVLREDLKKRNASEALMQTLEEILKLDVLCRALMAKEESIKAEQNKISKEIGGLKGKEKKKRIKEIGMKSDEEKKLLNESAQKAISELRHLLSVCEKGGFDIEKLKKMHLSELIKTALLFFPNLTHKTTPEGPDESTNKTENTHSTPRTFDFPIKDHVELGTTLGILNLEDATRMSGTRFAYLMGAGALLEFALIQFVMHKLVSKGFKPVVPPVLVREHAMTATGFFPADRNEIYHVNPKLHAKDNENEDLYLVGTAEVPLTMLHADKILEEEKLPLRYMGFSTCFRREAGSYGKDTQGIIRVHQFDKIEMFSFCHPEKSWEEHEFIRSIEEEIMQELGFAYRVVNICSGDLGYPASKKYDLEVWIPSQGKYRELTSCSNCTDYQARRAKIRYKSSQTPGGHRGSGKNEFVHTLNGTACAMGRTLVAIFENYQQADGSIEIPHVLQPYMNGATLISP